jgi:hypothetical protein
LSGGLKTSFSGSETSSKLRTEAERYTQQQDFQEAMREAQHAAHSLSHNASDETAKRLSEGISGNLERSESMRNEASKHFRKAEDYQSQASHTQSMASSINANYTQEFVSWLANQPADNASGNLGMRGAMHVIANEPALRQQYAVQFMGEQGLLPQPLPERMEHTQTVEDTIPTKPNAQYIDQVKQQSQKDPLGVDPSRTQSLKREVVDTSDTTQKRIQQTEIQREQEHVKQKELQHRRKLKESFAEIMKKLPPEGF